MTRRITKDLQEALVTADDDFVRNALANNTKARQRRMNDAVEGATTKIGP